MQKFVTRLTVILVVLATLVACGKKEQEQQTAPVGIKPTDIKIEKVVRQNIKDTYTLPGVVEAWEVVALATETSGPVSWIGVSEGESVKAGDPIMRINTESLLADLDKAKVHLEARRKDFVRTENLYKQQSVSQKTFDDSKDAFTLAEYVHRLATEELGKATVKSPVAGIVDNVVQKKGEFVSPGTKAATIVQLDKLKIYIDVPEKDIEFLKLGQEVEVYPADKSDNSLRVNGKISYLSVTSDPQTLTYKARIDIDGNAGIRAGRIVRSDVIRRDLNGVMLAELYAVLDKNGQKIVYVEKDGKAIETPVTIGPMVGVKAVILSGLKEGDNLVTGGQQFLQHETPVRIAGQ